MEGPRGKEAPWGKFEGQPILFYILFKFQGAGPGLFKATVESVSGSSSWSGICCSVFFRAASIHGEDEETMPWRRRSASLPAPGVGRPWSSACRCQGHSRYAVLLVLRGSMHELYFVCLPCIPALLLAFCDSVRLVKKKHLNWIIGTPEMWFELNPQNADILWKHTRKIVLEWQCPAALHTLVL